MSFVTRLIGLWSFIRDLVYRVDRIEACLHRDERIEYTRPTRDDDSPAYVHTREEADVEAVDTIEDLSILEPEGEL